MDFRGTTQISQKGPLAGYGAWGDFPLAAPTSPGAAHRFSRLPERLYPLPLTAGPRPRLIFPVGNFSWRLQRELQSAHPEGALSHGTPSLGGRDQTYFPLSLPLRYCLRL